MVPDLIEIGLLSVPGFFLLYLAVLSVLALAARPKKRSGVSPARNGRLFAILVPAHNEEQSIGKTLKSLFSVDYPGSMFDVIVIADNCTDKTSEIARESGAKVFERKDPISRGKGFALRWGFDRLVSGKPAYDAIVVVDADSIVSNNFLSVMHEYLERGARVIQSSDMVEPRPGSWSSEVTRLGFTLHNYSRPLGRRLLNCSAGLFGNGMCFTTEILRAYPWNAYSLNEDLEYGLMLVLRGITVRFAPEACVFAAMPADASNSESQRARWERGRYPIIRKYAGRLLKTAVKKISWKAFDAYVELVIPPFVNLMVVATALAGLNFCLGLLGVEAASKFALAWLALPLLGLVHVTAGLRAARADGLLYRALYYVPRYAAWKFKFYRKLYRGLPTKEWIRTARDRTVAPPVADKH